ncbi:TYRO protein tyrosine kinase-binding protein [Erpetoichthys calabaricus]|uniref:TYRO protein tyrosine kinase-binding protein n=1 Tax=Erpetoichthys calabaricus TaxID=27687 RepID=A0A8C4XF00_ERPCA|nr:TYRO protein tyrosine kinase-binding protein [Erpetoichthys calabaricus]
MALKDMSVVALFIFLGILGSTNGQQNCQSCYQLDLSAIVGIIVGDILLTVLIALSVFYFTSRLNKSRLEAIKAQGGLKLKEKEDKDESPYQELQGARSDIYSDLKLEAK